MRAINIILMAISTIVLFCIVSLYVYLGTYVFPIAPHWITQLPPNPPTPKVKHGEFVFKLEYEINGERKMLEDKLICDFKGFEVRTVGGPKIRKWKDYYENKQKREIFTFRNEPSRYTKIVLENIDIYKIVLGVGPAEYFMGEPEYRGMPELPSIQVYDTSTGYYKDPIESEEFLEQCSFKIIDWYCDSPIDNIFK